MPGWRSGWAPAFSSGHDPEIRDRIPHQAPCKEPPSPSACVFASLSLSECVSHEKINKSLKKGTRQNHRHLKSCWYCLEEKVHEKKVRIRKILPRR